MRRAVIAVALLAFVAVASAQGSPFLFPYSTCTRPLSQSIYSLSPASGVDTTTICWTIQVNPRQPVADAVCDTSDVHKFELDVRPSCARNFEGFGTLNGQRVGTAYIDTPPNAQSTAVSTLYVAGLGLTPATANGARFCLKITRGLCNTLTKLSPGGLLWQAALTSADHLCCPVTKYAPPPPPPSPPPPCAVCFTWTVSYPDSDVIVPFFGVAAHAAAAQTAAAAIFAPFVADRTIISSITYTATANTFTACFTTWSTPSARAMTTRLARLGVAGFLNPIFGITADSCPVDLQGLSVSVDGTPDVCANLFLSSSCGIRPPPFPFCECQRDRFITPFIVSPVAYMKGSKTYCVKVHSTGTPISSTRCTGDDNSGNTVDKIEFWFDYSLRYTLDYITVYTNGVGAPKAAIWGVPEENTLKVSQLGWSLQDVEEAEPEICFTMKRGASFEALTKGDHVWSSVFDPEQVCCPTYFSNFY